MNPNREEARFALALEKPPEVVLPDSYWGLGDFIFAEVVLDGQTVISEGDCLNYYVGPQFFDPPLTDGTFEAQGFIFAFPPLPVGVHTLITRGTALLLNPNLLTGNSAFGLVYISTCTITVVP